MLTINKSNSHFITLVWFYIFKLEWDNVVNGLGKE